MCVVFPECQEGDLFPSIKLSNHPSDQKEVRMLVVGLSQQHYSAVSKGLSLMLALLEQSVNH
jgi:hypothetical protein